jgi:hypothetical protein
VLFLEIYLFVSPKIHGILKQKFMYKIYYIIYVYVHHVFTYKKYFTYIFMYTLGDINFAEYVVQSFILFRRTYVNKIIGSFYLLLFIYLAGIH